MRGRKSFLGKGTFGPGWRGGEELLGHGVAAPSSTAGKSPAQGRNQDEGRKMWAPNGCGTATLSLHPLEGLGSDRAYEAAAF